MRILLVEDEPKLGAAIKRGLEQRAYAVDHVDTAERGYGYAEANDYDLILLDRMLPGGADGLAICRALRDIKRATPILMLTARDTVEDRVEGLNAGADDYLGKPFAFDELEARMQALLRRPNDVTGPVITRGQITIDPQNRTVSHHGILIALSPKEYALVEYLARRPGQILSKDSLIQHVWDFDADILPNTVEAFVGIVRKKFRAARAPSPIETVRGFGYRFPKEL